MYKVKKLMSVAGIVPLLSIALLASGCSLLNASLESNSASESEQNRVLSVKERERQAIALLTEVEGLIANGSNAKNIQLSQAKLNQVKTHLKYLPTSYTTVSVEVESSRRKRSSKRSSQRARKTYNHIAVNDDKYASLRAKALELDEQLVYTKQRLEQNATRIQTAKQFAFAAAKASQKPPHPVERWESIEQFWNKAIDELENVGENQPSYTEAQKLLKTYHTNLKIIQTRKQIEAGASETLDDIYDRVESMAKSPLTERQAYINELQYIIKQLKTIKPGTIAYADAQKLIASAQIRLKS